MKFSFELDHKKIEFSRNWFTGGARIQVGAESNSIQSALNPVTHFSFRLIKQWQYSVGEHDLIIEKERPLLLAGFRPNTYRVYVDKQLIKELKGF